MDHEAIRSALEFLRSAERLKDVTRTSWTSAGTRESVAAHTWRVTLMATVFAPEFPDVDVARLLKMCVIHDLGEAVGGDISAKLQPPDGKAEAERRDLLGLLQPLSADLQAELVELWDDYERAASPEARLAKALDKLETIMQHNQGANPPEFDYAFNLDYGRRYTTDHPLIAAIRGILDEETSARAEGVPAFQDHFSGTAADYAAHRPGYPSALVDFVADVAPHQGTAWDAGCGSGQLSVMLADCFEHVVATDASHAQIAHATPHPNVEYRCARAEDSGLPDASVDLAVAAQAAHWFELDAYHAEVRRVARPGAIIALASYGVMRIDEAVDRVVQRFYSEVLGPYWPVERRHVESGYRSLPFPFEEIDVPELEMHAEWKVADLLGYVDTWSAVRALKRAEGRERYQAFRRDLMEAWGSEPSTRDVRWPLALRAGRI